VAPKKGIVKKVQPLEIDPFKLSEDDDAESDSGLLAHLVQDVSLRFILMTVHWTQRFVISWHHRGNQRPPRRRLRNKRKN
jgi:hypothetical protein